MSSYDLGTASGTIQLNYQDNASGPAGASLDDIGSQAGDTAGQIGDALAGAFQLAVTAAAAASVAIVASLVKAGVGFNSMQQNADLAFTSILGSASAASDLIASLEQLTDAFHFPLADFESAAETMLNLGLNADQVTSALKGAADAAAALGGQTDIIGTLANAFGRIQVAGHLTSQVVTQLGRDGINALALISSATGQTADQIRDQISAGTLDAASAIQDLTTGMENQFGAAGAAVSSTWTGAMDNVKSQYEALGSALAAPLVSPTSGGAGVSILNDLASVMTTLLPLATALATMFSNFIAPAIAKVNALVADFSKSFDVSGAMGALSSLLPVLVGVGAIIDSFLPKLLEGLPVVGNLFKDFAAPVGLFAGLLGLVIANSAPLRATLVNVLQDAAGILQKLAPLFTIVTGVINQVAGVVGGALSSAINAVLPSLLSTLTTLIPIVTQVAGVLAGALGKALVALAPVIAKVASVVGEVLANALAIVAPLIAGLAPIFVKLIDAILPIITAILPVLAPLLGSVGTMFDSILQALTPLIPVVIQLVGAVVQLIAPLLGLIAPILVPLIQLFTQLLAAVLPIAIQISSLLLPVLVVLIGILAQVITWVADFVTTIIQWAEGNKTATKTVQTVWGDVMNFFAGIGSFFTGIWNGLVNGVATFITGIVKKISSIQKSITDVFVDAGTWLYDTGKNIVQGIIDGVGDMITKAVDAVKKVGGAMLKGIKSFLGIASPSKVFQEQVGQMMGAGIIQGLQDSMPAVNAQVAALAGAIPTALQMSVNGSGTMSTANGSSYGIPPTSSVATSNASTDARSISIVNNISERQDAVSLSRVLGYEYIVAMGGQP